MLSTTTPRSLISLEMGIMLPSKERTVWMLKSDIKDALPKTMILVLFAFTLRKRLSAHCFTALRQLGITDSKILIAAEAGNTRTPTLSSANPAQSKLHSATRAVGSGANPSACFAWVYDQFMKKKVKGT